MRARALAAVAGILLSAACAAPVRRPPAAAPVRPSGLADQRPAARLDQARPVVGVALGGGSARGIAHVGVLRWFDEHRIPIDVAAGTSMGGLVGGAFATGMDADELERMIVAIDWDVMFGASDFAFRNIRRKTDGRAFPSRLEFGLKGGIVPPSALNNGAQVERLLARIAAPYAGIAHFDELPTPFRAVAVDLVTATEVILQEGSLAQALRATMSLPLVFPPVELDGRVLVDGGAMNNVPANVVQAMGAGRVIAVNVGDLGDREGVPYTLPGLADATIDAMMRASTRAALAAADLVVDVPLDDFDSLDWRRAPELIEAGYAAAEAEREALLAFAVSEQAYDGWRRQRDQRRRRSVATPAFVVTEGFVPDDARRLDALLAGHVGVPLEIAALERDLDQLTGLDRYESVTWGVVTNPAGEPGLLVRGRPRPFAPPFMMLGVNLENTTSSDFRIAATARYLAFDTVGSGSELRVDATLGSNPAAAVELYRPIGPTPFFVAPYAGAGTATYDLVSDDAVVARYGLRQARAGVNLGVNLGARSDVRAGVYLGRLDTGLQVGDPGLPELAGAEAVAELAWRYDGQDSPVVPSRGTLATVRLARVLNGPDVEGPLDDRSDSSLTQLSGVVNRFWSPGGRDRFFVYGGLGTSFDDRPLPTSRFRLGAPLRLSAYNDGEISGDHFYMATAGYLRQVGRLPDFMGGGVFAGGWLENGDAFDDWSLATWRSNLGLGVIMDTLVGPVLVGGSAGFDGRWRTYVGVGRILR